jgi:hypothetical protein
VHETLARVLKLGGRISKLIRDDAATAEAAPAGDTRSG